MLDDCSRDTNGSQPDTDMDISALDPTKMTIQHFMGVRLQAPEPRTPDVKSNLTIEGHSSHPSTAIQGTLGLSGSPNAAFFMGPSAAPATGKSKASAAAAVDELFAPIQTAWKAAPLVSPAKVLESFAAIFADKAAFGTKNLPGMQPSAGWRDLQKACSPPVDFVDEMARYYVTPPVMSKA